jgi:hypothetical protein
MKYHIAVDIANVPHIELELDDNYSESAKTIQEFVKNLPFTVGINLWGEEIYTEPSPISIPEENAKHMVALNDVAYWPTGKAICLFYGPTPISPSGDKIKPYSPVNIIGKILHPDKKVLEHISNNMDNTQQQNARFTLVKK